MAGGRTPPGVRGLKPLFLTTIPKAIAVSHPTRGAWIETIYRQEKSETLRPSHPTRGAWIET